MCVIIVSPREHKIPSKSELKKAYKRNHDGCGFVSETQSYKSLDFEDFYWHLQKVPQSENVIIHFRWATHGSVCLDNCHPFHDKRTDTYFAHNGVLDIRPYKDMTDSETAFRRYIAPAIAKFGLYSVEVKNIVNNIIGYSKFAFMQNGDLRVFGHFIEYGGCYYSNLHHLNVPLRHVF